MTGAISGTGDGLLMRLDVSAARQKFLIAPVLTLADGFVGLHLWRNLFRYQIKMPVPATIV